MANSDWAEIVSVNKRGGVTLPARMRELMSPQSPVVRMSEVGPGKFLVEIVDVVPVADRWFHEEEWQRKEREADDDIRAGRVHDLGLDGIRGSRPR